MEFVSNRIDKLPFPSGAGITSRIVEKAFQKGLLVYPAAGAVDGVGDAIIVAPPFVITEEEIDLLVQILDESVREVMAEVTRSVMGGDMMVPHENSQRSLAENKDLGRGASSNYRWLYVDVWRVRRHRNASDD